MTRKTQKEKESCLRLNSKGFSLRRSLYSEAQASNFVKQAAAFILCESERIAWHQTLQPKTMLSCHLSLPDIAQDSSSCEKSGDAEKEAPAIQQAAFWKEVSFSLWNIHLSRMMPHDTLKIRLEGWKAHTSTCWLLVSRWENGIEYRLLYIIAMFSIALPISHWAS